MARSTEREGRQAEDGEEVIGSPIPLLKACALQKDLYKGSQIHADIVERGLLATDAYVGCTLVHMYARCGALGKAREVFDELPIRNVVSWNALITGYAKHGRGKEALNCFEQMQREGFCPDVVTFTCILKACGSIRAADKGQDVHAKILREGLLKNNIMIGNGLVDMYAKCGALAKAQEVFDELPLRNVICWTALIAGYAQHGHGEEALNCFRKMQREGFSPDAVAFTCILKACGSVGATEEGQEIHAAIVREGLLEKDMLLGTALMDMYARCGALAKAHEVFNDLPVRDLISWTALIAGYAQHGHGEEALNCFERMQCEGLSPDAVTFTCALKACGSIGAAGKGQELHAKIMNEGYLKTNLLVGTALVDMYAKCGVLAKAQEVFSELPVRDVASWNALIAGNAQLGKIDVSFKLFDKMLRDAVKPDTVTFTVLLNACTHSGLLGKGKMYFNTMSTCYGISPTLEHYTCMIDLFGRAGHFDKAVAGIKKMPFSANFAVWHTLLGACRKWGNVKLGVYAFEQAIQLDEKDASAYVCMRNIFTAAGKLEDADKVEALRVKKGAWTKPERCWWTDVSGRVHSFAAGDERYSQTHFITAKLESIACKILQEGYSPGLQWVTSGDAKKDVLCGHREMVAIAYALINTPEGVPIHVVKNMRICDECHYDTSLISKIENRRIFVKDASRFHIFENGKCACGDHW